MLLTSQQTLPRQTWAQKRLRFFCFQSLSLFSLSGSVGPNFYLVKEYNNGSRLHFEYTSQDAEQSISKSFGGVTVI